MTKREIFDIILDTCADVCNVKREDIINACRREDVSTARAILVFWCDAAGFTVETLVRFCECNNANSINSVRARIEPMWIERYAFHLLVIEVGKRLLEFARCIGDDFDVNKPIRRIARNTGKHDLKI